MPEHSRSGPARAVGRTRIAIISISAVGVAVAALLILGERNPPTPAPPEARPVGPSAEPAPDEEIRPVARTPRAVEDPEDTIPVTSLPLRLVATAVSEDPAPSLARIEDAQWPDSQLVQEGQRLAGRPTVRIVRIERRRVLLDNYGVTEQLPLEASGQVLFDGPAPPSEPLEIDPEERERRRELAENLRALRDAGERFEPETRRSGLLNEGTLESVYVDGSLAGVRLGQVRPGGIYDRAGLRDGDLVTSVNDVALGAPGATAELAAEVAAGNDLTVEVERPDGSQEQLTVPAEQMLRLLNELPAP